MANALRAFGIDEESVAAAVDATATEDFGIWPENWAALGVFLAMSTQWRVGFSGAYGLDYAVLPIVESRLGIARAQRPEVFGGLRILESAVLEQVRHGR